MNLAVLRRSLPLVLALAIYLGASALWIRGVGVVGEVDLSWGLGRPPAALVQLDPPLWADGAATPSAGDRRGPLVASLVRPIEGLRLGGLDLPLAVNSYTGGLADWPARLVWLATGSRRAVVGLHIGLGALLIALVHRFLRLRAGEVPAQVAALVLACDWSFLFYRKVLGGTELLLLGSALLCLWALWSRRWGGGRHGLWILGLAVGLGLQAKITFALSLGALGLATLLSRWDRPALRPPLNRGIPLGGLLVALLLLPLLLSWAHHALAVPQGLQSHDFPALQGRRVLGALRGDTGSPRESLANLGIFFSEPLAFFGPAYGLPDPPPPSPLRLLGFGVVLVGALLGFRRPHPSAQEALLRFCAIFVPLQVLALGLVARDLHHLAQASLGLAILAGLACSRLAALFGPSRSPRHQLIALLLASPLLLAGLRSSQQTDPLLERLRVPTFTEQGQAAMVDLLRAHGVRRLYLADYESYGMLELRAPELEIIHAWPAIQGRPQHALPDLLALAAGHHLLWVQESQPMGYNLRLKPDQLERLAAEEGHRLVREGELPGGTAILYRVDR